MKKNKESFSPYKEMDIPKREIEETLPFENVENSDEKRDYLEEFDQADQQVNQSKNYSQPLMFTDERTDNLVMWQLRVDWERVEHIIRGHKPMVDPKTGEEYFVKMQEHYLNDYGVNSILHFLSFYLSKEIFLARYSKEEVKVIMKNFATQFTDFFYDNIEEFGLDTPQKKKMSKMFVQAVIDLVDASYSKAIEGKTAELVNKQFQVLQQQPIEEPNPYQNIPQRRGGGIMQRIFG